MGASTNCGASAHAVGRGDWGPVFFLRKKAALVFRNAGTVRKTASQFSSPTA